MPTFGDVVTSYYLSCEKYMNPIWLTANKASVANFKVGGFEGGVTLVNA
jgi:hypothetical protein